MKLFLLFLAVVFLNSCKTSAPSTAADGSGFRGRMQQIAESFTTLLPMAMDPVQFNDPKNQDLIDSELTRLATFAHDVGNMPQKPSDDPSLEFVGKQFSADMVEAKRQLKIGNRGYARYIIRGASNYCVSCHTQADRGPHFLAQPTGSYFNKLSSLDKANFLIAVTSYDSGLAEYEKAMTSPDIAKQPYSTLENATLRALAVAVRVRKDPALAEAIVTRITKSKWAPVHLQMSADKWRSSIQEWKSAKRPSRNLNDAKALMSKAWIKQLESPLAKAGLVESLRASALLHELLAQKKPGKAYAETLYVAGMNAEALRDLDPFTLNEVYYESCIRQMPHSEISKNCYLRLEGAQVADYSGLDSAPMPTRVRENLAILRKLAEPTQGSWKEWGQGHD